MILPDPPILVITDRRQCPDPLDVRAKALFDAGCRFLSLREKDMAPNERRALLRKIALLGRPYGATVGIHDDLDAAQSCGTALHLPAGADVAAARHRLGPKALIGQSCHDRQEIAAAAQGGASYVTISPIFDSTSKPGYAALNAVAGIIAGFTIPILALGGITPDTLPRLPAGFAGIATMGQAMTAPAPSVWFAEIRTAWSVFHTV